MIKQTLISTALWLLIIAQTSLAVEGPLLPIRDHSDALADRQANYPNQNEWGFIYYLTLGNLREQERDDLRIAVSFMVASSSLQLSLEDTLPVPVPNTNLLRIDLRNLGWSYSDWRELLETRYPYSRNFPLVVRADWLLLELADAQESNAYYTLMFGSGVENVLNTSPRKPPGNIGEALKVLGVQNNVRLKFGLVEGKSRVSKQGIRLIENRPVQRGYAWGTSDVLELNNETDPITNIAVDQPFDGQEWIIGVPKFSSTTGVRGTLQVYILNNGKGDLVGRAPVDLVEDSTEFRGLREIRAPGSCIQCHSVGINEFTRNEVRHLTETGIQISSDKETTKQIQEFHLSNLDKEVSRNCEDYGIMVRLVSGQGPVEFAEIFKRAVNRYDRPLGLLETCEELGVPAVTWSEAINFGTRTPNINPRLPSLLLGEKIPRTLWEEHWLYSVDLVTGYRRSTR